MKLVINHFNTLKNNYHSEFLLIDCEFLLLTMPLTVAYA